MQLSTVQQRGAVSFPAFTGERIYMREFRKESGLPADLVRWQPTVDAMLDGVDAAGPIFLMVDQRQVFAAQTHRRPGVHVDGHWLPCVQAHGHGLGRHTVPPRPRSLEPEALIPASDVLGCAAFVGEYEGEPAIDGDCSHLDLSGLQRVEMEPGLAWAGHTMTMLHESTPVSKDCFCTVVRLNVKGWA